jgi:hypothetical protein
VLSVEQFLAQKWITENGTPTLILWFGFTWLLAISKYRVCLEGMNILGYWSHKKSDNSTESYSTTGVPKMFLTVAASMDKVHGYSWGVLRRWPLSVCLSIHVCLQYNYSGNFIATAHKVKLSFSQVVFSGCDCVFRCWTQFSL